MSIKEIIKNYTAEEIADSFVLPVGLTAEQAEEAKKQLAEHRLKRRENITADTVLKIKLMQFKLRLEEYINSDRYEPQNTFGFFLGQYISLTNKKQKEFAHDIHVHETLLNNMIKDRREPSRSVFIRLELHSNNIIPAIYWYKLVEKETEHYLRTDTALRKKEIEFVTAKLKFV
jgi:hypothetical protein